MILRKLISYVSLLLLVCALVVLGASTATAQQCVSLTGGTYTQNFDTLASTGTSSTMPTGWFFSESGTNANTTYTAGTGSGNAGDTYSFGASGSTNRALGGLQSGSLIPTFGACFTNNTGSTLSAMTVQYLGRQFRLGTSGRADRIDFQYSTDATSLTTGTWANVDLLDFSSQITTGTVGAVTASAQVGPQVVSGFSVAPGATIWIRWTDFNASGADDGLAVDDFSLTAGGAPASTNPTATGTATATIAGGTTTFSGTITPGTNPDSISYTVSCNLSTVGDGTSYALGVSGTTISGTYNVPGGVAANTYPLPCVVTDDQNRAGNFSISLTISAQSLTIMQIQGSGSRSPHEGESVQTTGVVYDVGFNGYWIQYPDPRPDGYINTSYGIFVFTSSTPSGIAKGDFVNVAGKVSEFATSGDPSASPQTEIIQPSATVISHGNAIPDPVTITASDIDPDGGIDQLERYEGMRVHIDTLNVIAPTGGSLTEATAISSSNGVFFGVIPGLPRPFRKAGIELPATAPAGAPCCIPFWNGAPQRIRVDTDVLSAAQGQGLNLTSGAVVSNLTGPLDFGQHAYTIVTETLPNVDSGNISAIPVPTPSASEFTVASFNMQRFYNNVDDPGGDTVLTTTAFNNRLNKASLAIRNVMMMPDVIGVEEMEDLPTLQTLAAKVNNDAVAAGQPNPGYTGYLVEGNDVGLIDVGFLVKSRVNVVSVTQYGKNTTYTEPGGGTALLNDRPPLVLSATINSAGHTTPFTVIVVHQRSLSSVDDPVDGPRVREKRRVQAEFLANLIQQFQTGDPTIKIISVGDFNAFEVNDGYVDVMGTVNGAPTPADQVTLASPDLVDPNMIDLATSLPAEQRYSYINFGTSQTLDHAIVNPNMMSIFSRFSYARNDADFPEVYRSDANRPERISDHDMEVAYFTANHAPTVNAGQSFTLGMGQVNIVGTVTGSDADGDALSNWQITGGDGAAYFAIDPATGQITVPNPGALDTSRTTPYSLLVTVSDGSATSDPTLVTINPAPIVAGSVNLVATATLTKQGSSYVATVKVSNRGTGTAQNVVLGGATLGAANGSPVPQSLVNIPPGGYAITTVTFPASAGNSGTMVIQRYSGTYTGGSFLTSLRAVLP